MLDNSNNPTSDENAYESFKMPRHTLQDYNLIDVQLNEHPASKGLHYSQVPPIQLDSNSNKKDDPQTLSFSEE